MEREGNLLRCLPSGYVIFLINYQKASCQKSAPYWNSDLFIVPFKSTKYMYVFA